MNWWFCLSVPLSCKSDRIVELIMMNYALVAGMGGEYIYKQEIRMKLIFCLHVYFFYFRIHVYIFFLL